MNTNERIDQGLKFANGLTVKMVLLGFLVLVLLIPLEMIKSTIRDREQTSNEAKREIFKQWSKAQMVAGPILNVPALLINEKNGDKEQTVLHIMPEKLNIDGKIMPEIRKRGIFKTVLYTANMAMKGSFSTQKLLLDTKYQYDWEKAYISFGVTDQRGLKNNIKLEVDNVPYAAIPGLSLYDLSDNGIHFDLLSNIANKNFTFDLKLDLTGSERLEFIPVGTETSLNLKSTWSDPKFSGDFLPDTRSVTKNGFEALWSLNQMNSSFPNYWMGNQYSFKNNTFGVELLMPLDHYDKSMRSAKYGVLFILLTFVVLLFIELLKKNKLQFFHYILVALSLILFFSLLTAFSEQIGFNMAYIVSATATISLIVYFIKGIIDDRTSLMVLTGVLIGFYCFIFVLLSLNDYAFLAGNIGLFIILAAIMGFARRIKN